MATKSGSGSGRKKSTPDDIRLRVIDATLGLAAEQGWARLSLAAVAEAAGLSLVEVYRTFPSKGAILAAFERRIDEQVLAGGPAAGDEPARDRLFDILMRRFDALSPHKAAIAAILRDLPAMPLGAACAVPRLLRSMRWMLEAAGLSAAGPVGQMRARGLALIYAHTARTWLHDDSADLSATMAALDADLRRAETAMRLIPCRPGMRRPRDDQDEVA